MRASTPSFVAEFPLRTTATDEAMLGTRFDAARNLYNETLHEALRRLAHRRESRDWQRARLMPKFVRKTANGKLVPNKARSDLFKSVAVGFEFDAASIQKHAESCRDACWIGEHLGSHDTQTTSLRAFRAVEQYAFGKRGRPRFKGYRRLHSVEGKGDAVMRFRDAPLPVVHWAGLVLPLRLDRKDKRRWQQQALGAPNKYVRIVRRSIRGRDRWFCPLVQRGQPPRLHDTRSGLLGCDVGPSTSAAVWQNGALLERFCPSVEQPWAESRRRLRKMDRSRRATNPACFDHKGRFKTGRVKLSRSMRYQHVAQKRREAERRVAAERKRSHGAFANRVLVQGTTIKSEGVSYKSFQKNYGRSVKVRAPGMQMSMLRRKAARAGGGVLDINTRTTKLSQFDHTTEDYVKKPLSQRLHVFRDGRTEPVQRDLYSAFLATCCSADTLDRVQVHAAWPGAQPLLRRAMSRSSEPASGKGFARPHGRKRVGAGRPSKGAGHSGKAGRGCSEAQADVRAPESVSYASLRTPWP